MDWEAFFKDYRVDYITRGQNVKKGNVNIPCPFCGDDPSYHMGVSLHSKGWGCWRSASHAGKKPNRLIRALLNSSYQAADVIVRQYSTADPADLDEAINRLEASVKPATTPDRRRELMMPSDFKVIKPKGTTARFWQYLERRGFPDVEEVAEIYKLRCASTGTWKDRIIIPIYMDGKLQSWTSRALGNPVNAPRYLALGEEQGSLINVFHSLWNWDELQHGGEILIVTEGPFDALKLDYFGIEFDCCATCTFGTAMSIEQAMLIGEASKRFKRTLLVYDRGATEAIFLAQDKLVHTNVTIGFLPETVDDPGEMSKSEVRKYFRSLLTPL